MEEPLKLELNPPSVVLSENGNFMGKKPPLSPRPQSASPKPSMYPSLFDCEPPASIRFHSNTRSCSKISTTKPRVRSSSAGRSPDLRSRYWALLFENLRRAVDEIYQTCELDESVPECEETVLILENYTKDFRSLIKWLKLSKDLENGPGLRTTSLSWEIRKSSPAKGMLKTLLTNFNSSNNKLGKNTSTTSACVQTEIEFSNKAIDFESSNKDSIIKENINLSKNIQSIPEVEKLSDTPQSTIKENIIKSIEAVSDSRRKALPIQEPLVTASKAENISEKPAEQLKEVEMSGTSSPSAELEHDKETNVILGPEAIENIQNEELKTTSYASNQEIINTILGLSASQIKMPLPELTSDEMSSAKTILIKPDNLTPPIIVAAIEKSGKPETILTKNAESKKPLTSSNANSVSVNKSSGANSVSTLTGLSNVKSNNGPHLNSQRPGSMTSRSYTAGEIRRTGNNIEKRPFVTGSGYGRGNLNYRSGQSNLYQNKTNSFKKQPASANSKVNYGAALYKQVLPLKMNQMTKNEQKTGSTSSISSTSSCQSWADKVKGVPAPENTVEGKTTKDEEDNDGWETVHRGRTRSRNSPVKKIASESNLTLINSDEGDMKPLECRSNSDLHVTMKPQPKRFVRNVSSNPIATRKAGTAKDTEKQAIIKAPFKREIAALSFRNMSNIKPKLSAVSGKTNTLINMTKNTVKKIANEVKSEEKELKGTEDTKLKKDEKPGEDKMNALCEIRMIESEEETINAYGDFTNEKDSNLKPILNKSTENIELKNEGKEEENVLVSEESLIETKENIEKEIEELEKLENEIKSVSLSGVEMELRDKENKSDPAEDASLVEDDSDDSSDESDLNDDEDELEEIDTNDDCDSQSDEISDKLLQEEEDRVHQLGLSWGDQMDTLDLELRTPGRALQVHEKLSSPFKKRSLSETIRLQEEKQAKAQEQRERLLVEKKQRLKGKVKKAEEKKALMEEQLEQKRLTMEIKLQKAEEKRKIQIQNRIRKARDEEEKVNEIAFINTLEAQNKRHDLMSKEKDHEARLSEIQEERHKRLEEKAAKEAAAEERRKTLEAERQARLLELQEKRKLRDMKIEQQIQEKEKERVEMANQKARDREQRISALNAAQQATVEELQKKIQQKQEESARRHEENIELIRHKAFELSVRRYSSNNDDAPRLVPYETKKICTLCNVLIGSEVYLLSHLRGKKHQGAVNEEHQGTEPSTEVLELYNLKHIVDATGDQLNPELSLDKERQKALKKRCKKIRQRMINRGSEWEKENTEKNGIVESDFKQKFQKNIKDVRKHVNALSTRSWENSTVTSLERSLGEFERSLEKGKRNDRLTFRVLGGMAALVQFLELIVQNESPEVIKIIPTKTLVRACSVYGLACLNCFENCQLSLHTNKVVTLLDLLMHRLNGMLPENSGVLFNSNSDVVTMSIPTDSVAGALLKVLATAMKYVHQKPFVDAIKSNSNNPPTTKGPKMNNETVQRVQDVVSYTVSMGIVDKLSNYLANVQAPIDAEPQACDFILQVLEFLTALAKLMDSRYDCVFDSKKEDNTQLLATFRVTQLGGAVSLLYGILLHSGAPSRGETKPPQLDGHTEAVSLSALRMLNYLAVLDIQLFQSVLGGEGLSLQLRHIASYLLWYSSHWSSLAMLHEVILLVGHFTVMSSDNQSMIQSGQRPTVLQQLSVLPFPYFSDPDLTEILFPSLIACCFDHAGNKAILEQDMSAELLSNYLEACLLDVHSRSSSVSGIADIYSKVNSEENIRWNLSSRFPKNKWTTAKKFFSSIDIQNSN